MKSYTNLEIAGIKKYFPILVFVSTMFIMLPGCKKQTDQPALENTTWKLTKEIWTFPNGNTEIFAKQSDLDGLFSWSFLGNQELRVKWEPYTVEQTGTWNRTGDRITTTIPAGAGGNAFMLHYRILKLTGSFMKVDFEDQNASSINGQASKVYYELTRQ